MKCIFIYRNVFPILLLCLYQMYADILLQIYSTTWELGYCIYLLLVEIVYDIYYFTKPRKCVCKAPESELLMKSAKEIHGEIIRKEVTCEAVTTAFIERIKEVNPLINAMIFDNFPKALEKAKEIDERLKGAEEEERKQLSSEYPLLGVPFSIKNNVHVEGFPLTDGLTELKDNMSTENADVVDLMQAAGAIHICITNVPEYCGWIETSNKLFGYTNNPYDTRRTPGGSSGGESALIAAAGSTIGVGTDIGGSIRVPAMFCGIFGLKPTPLVVSQKGVEPKKSGIRSIMSTPGPICRYSVDLLPMFRVLCKSSEFDKMVPVPDMAQIQVLRHLEDSYKKVVVPIDIPYQKEMFDIVITALQVGLEKPFCDLAGGTKTVKEFFTDLYSTFRGETNTKHARFSPQVNMTSLIMKGVDEETQEKFMQMRQSASQKLERLLNKHGILVMPGWPTPPVYHNMTVFKHYGITQTAMWNALGFPVVAVPLGLNKEGLPLAVQIIGNRYMDLTLIKIAEMFDGQNSLCRDPEEFPGYVPPWEKRFNKF